MQLEDLQEQARHNDDEVEAPWRYDSTPLLMPGGCLLADKSPLPELVESARDEFLVTAACECQHFERKRAADRRCESDQVTRRRRQLRQSARDHCLRLRGEVERRITRNASKTSRGALFACFASCRLKARAHRL